MSLQIDDITSVNAFEVEIKHDLGSLRSPWGVLGVAQSLLQLIRWQMLLDDARRLTDELVRVVAANLAEPEPAFLREALDGAVSLSALPRIDSALIADQLDRVELRDARHLRSVVASVVVELIAASEVMLLEEDSRWALRRLEYRNPLDVIVLLATDFSAAAGAVYWIVSRVQKMIHSHYENAILREDLRTKRRENESREDQSRDAVLVRRLDELPADARTLDMIESIVRASIDVALRSNVSAPNAARTIAVSVKGADITMDVEVKVTVG